MTGVFTQSFAAGTIEEAREKALQAWRKFSNDEKAELPWSTHMQVSNGSAGDDFSIEVIIEFNDKAAPSSASSV
jgi:hypothetical protein